MNLTDFFTTLSTHNIGKIFRVNLLEHIGTGVLSSQEVTEAIETFHEPSSGLPGGNSSSQDQYVRMFINSFCQHAKSQGVALRTGRNPGAPEHCALATILTREVEDRYFSAVAQAERADRGSNRSNPANGSDEHQTWFTQDHDLTDRHGHLCDANTITERLGLIHRWVYGTELVLFILDQGQLNTQLTRPTTLEGQDNPAYLALSFGERFGRKLSQLNGAGLWQKEWARALDLAKIYAYGRVRDGAIEAIGTVSNSVMLAARTQRFDLGVVDWTQADQSFLVQEIANIRA